MNNNIEDFELNLLGIENYHKNSNSRLRFWFNHIRDNALKDNGDIFEFGVYRGSSIIAAALILKEVGSKKKVFGFDTFKGFPKYSKEDNLESFYEYKGKNFSEEFIKKFEKFKRVKNIITGINDFDKVSIASSGDFSETSYDLLLKKIEYFKLDNIEIIQGPFSDTLENFFKENKCKVSSANLDCDLYESYKVCLPLVYDNLSNYGYIHLDEYFSFKYPGAKIACDEFFQKRGIKAKKNKTRINEFERWYLTK